MTPEQFELGCLKCTLRTRRLKPSDILCAGDKLPENQNDPLLDLPRPTWIGQDYRVGGVLLLGKNPAGGSPVHLLESHPLDATLADALRQLRDRQDIGSYRHWRHVHLEVMSDQRGGWRIWHKSALAVIEKLGVGETSVAFGNLVPFRVEGNQPSTPAKKEGCKQDISHVVTLLEPKLIVDMSGGIPASCRDYFENIEILRFRRSNGDRHIIEAAQSDLTKINQWAARHRDIRSQSPSGSTSVCSNASTNSQSAMNATLVYHEDRYQEGTLVNAKRPNRAHKFGPFKIANLSAILNRSCKRDDPRWVFYDAMTEMRRYEDYFSRFGDMKVYPDSYRSSARTAYTEMAWAMKQGWIVDA